MAINYRAPVGFGCRWLSPGASQPLADQQQFLWFPWDPKNRETERFFGVKKPRSFGAKTNQATKRQFIY